MPTYHMTRGTLGYMNTQIPYVVVSSGVNVSYTRPLPVQCPLLQLIQPHNPAQLLELNQLEVPLVPLLVSGGRRLITAAGFSSLVPGSLGCYYLS